MLHTHTHTHTYTIHHKVSTTSIVYINKPVWKILLKREPGKWFEVVPGHMD